MATITMLAEFFLFSVGLGVGGFSFLADTQQTGAGFLKVIAGICGAALLLATALHLTYSSFGDWQTLLYGLSLLAFLGIYLFHKDRKGPLMWGLFGVHTLSLIALLMLFQNNYLDSFLFSLSSVALLGSITYAMVMGHWYLVTPRLSEKPLKMALYCAWFILIIKLVVTLVGYLEAEKFFNTGTSLGMGYLFNWIMLAMRIGWGYLAVGVMSYFAYRLISMRSIQSATGLLYAMTFFVFVGELISIYMFFQYGLYL